MQANPKAIGERTEAIVLAALVRRGYAVLLPFGNNQRYDLVVDKGDGRFVRGQCKTANFKNGCISFWTCSNNGFTFKKTGYRGQIEVFWVYSPQFDQVYEIPVDAVGERKAHLRVDPARGGSISNIRWARDFLLADCQPQGHQFESDPCNEFGI